MNIRHMTIAIMLLLTLQTSAQRRRTSRVPQPTPEQIQKQERLERMRNNTEHVMFIDSIVTNKADFLKSYILNPETGSIDTYQNHFHQNRHPNCYAYVNELGNLCYLSQENNEGAINLYISERVNNKWSRPTKLRGINDNHQFQQVNYPFMMGDGQTFYFAAVSDDGLGGYDIYTSTYDKDSQRFLQPVNIGMPFNSDANDYMFVIDEYSNLGWFATDRNQPEDTVCVYTFIPNDIRTTYNLEDHTPEEMEQFACIASIRNTWDNDQQLSQAIARLQMTKDRLKQQVKGRDFTFVINDDVSYYQLNDFKATDNVDSYHRLSTIRARYNKLLATLERARNYYVTATPDEREELRPEILATEQKQHELYTEIHQLEKSIRNKENIFLTKNK